MAHHAKYDRDNRLPERIELMQFWADRIDEYRSSDKPKKGKVRWESPRDH